MNIREIKEQRDRLIDEIDNLENIYEELSDARENLDGTSDTLSWLDVPENLSLYDCTDYIKRAIEEIDCAQDDCESELSAKRDELAGLPDVDDYYMFEELTGNAIIKAIVEIKKFKIDSGYENMNIQKIMKIADNLAFDEDGSIVEV